LLLLVVFPLSPLPLPLPPIHLCGRHAAGRLILAKRDGAGSGILGRAEAEAAEGDDGVGMLESMAALVVGVVFSLSLLVLLDAGETLRLAAAREGFRAFLREEASALEGKGAFLKGGKGRKRMRSLLDHEKEEKKRKNE